MRKNKRRVTSLGADWAIGELLSKNRRHSEVESAAAVAEAEVPHVTVECLDTLIRTCGERLSTQWGGTHICERVAGLARAVTRRGSHDQRLRMVPVFDAFARRASAAMLAVPRRPFQPRFELACAFVLFSSEYVWGHGGAVGYGMSQDASRAIGIALTEVLECMCEAARVGMHVEDDAWQRAFATAQHLPGAWEALPMSIIGAAVERLEEAAYYANVSVDSLEDAKRSFRPKKTTYPLVKDPSLW